MKRLPLVHSFALYSSIAFSITGLILVSIISGHIRDDKLANLQELTSITVQTVDRNRLDAIDLNQVIPQQAANQILLDVADLLRHDTINKIMLVNRARTVILSSQAADLGQSLPADASFDEIINTNPSNSLASLPGVLDEVLDISVYEPITRNGVVEGVFIFQLSGQVLKAHTNMIIQAVAMTLAGGLLLLFVLLIGILSRTSKSLIKQNESLVMQNTEIEKAYAQLDDSYRETMLTLSNAIDVRDPYTAGHSDRVTALSLLLADKLVMSDEGRKALEYAALFHDIGKLGIPETILLKTGKLTDAEFEAIKNHPNIGASILENIGFLKDALPIIRHHHERYSGCGYPDGMVGDLIPLGSRIIAIADTYDAMTSDRPYRKRLSHEAAIHEIERNRGIQFDNKLVDLFLEIECDIREI